MASKRMVISTITLNSLTSSYKVSCSCSSNNSNNIISNRVIEEDMEVMEGS